jgi:hypothetical protein
VTTTVAFGEVRIPDLATSLWLPAEVQVYGEFTGLSQGVDSSLIFRNDHHYTDYQRYRVAVKMLTDSVDTVAPRYVLPLVETDQSYYADAHPYLDEPLKKSAVKFRGWGMSAPQPIKARCRLSWDTRRGTSTTSFTTSWISLRLRK